MSAWLWRWLVSLLLARIKAGSLIVLEGEARHVYGSGAPAATVRIDSPRTWRKLLGGSRGVAEAFAQGLWDSPDLVALIRLAARNAGGLDWLRSWLAPLRWPLQRAGALVRRSTKRRRRRDIAAHYDLGNELFARMLDPTMSYSCAVFEHDAMTLEQAQVAKVERICEQLDHADELAQLGYDKRFRRLWRLYLAYCEAGFAERRICDVQLLLTKPRSRIASRTHRNRSGHSQQRDLSLSA